MFSVVTAKTRLFIHILNVMKGKKKQLKFFSIQNFPAENLMKEGKKWKCAEPGVDAAYVILQLEKPSKITGIDIGNEGSAYVTVFVGKSGWTEDRYKVHAD